MCYLYRMCFRVMSRFPAFSLPHLECFRKSALCYDTSSRVACDPLCATTSASTYFDVLITRVMHFHVRWPSRVSFPARLAMLSRFGGASQSLVFFPRTSTLFYFWHYCSNIKVKSIRYKTFSNNQVRRRKKVHVLPSVYGFGSAVAVILSNNLHLTTPSSHLPSHPPNPSWCRFFYFFIWVPLSPFHYARLSLTVRAAAIFSHLLPFATLHRCLALPVITYVRHEQHHHGDEGEGGKEGGGCD